MPPEDFPPPAMPDPVPDPTPEPGSLPPQVGLGMALLAEGLQRGLAWARRSIVEPHADHGDLTEHADCVLCVAMLALQGATETTLRQPMRAPSSTFEDQTPDAQSQSVVIEWVPVRRRTAGSDD